MAKVICITSGLTGILNASFEVVDRLQKAGHQVVCSSPSNVGRYVSKQGFEFYQLDEINFNPAPPPPAPKANRKFQRLNRILLRWLTSKNRREAGIVALKMDRFSQMLQKLKPDLILADVEVQEYIMTAYALGYKVAIISPWFSTFRNVSMPPYGAEIIPVNKSLESRVIIFWLYVLQSFQVISSVYKSRLRTFWTDRLSVLRSHAKRIGFPVKLMDPFSFPPPCHFRRLPIITMNARALEFPHRKRKNQYYVGPMVCMERKDINVNERTLQSLLKIFEERGRTGKKLIFCSMSSKAEGEERLLLKIIDVFKARKDWILVIGLGNKFDIKKTTSEESNINIFSWTPTLTLLKNCDCAIIPASINTINECIFMKVPMLVFSLKVNDQGSCAARIKWKKLGLTFDKDQTNTSEIHDKIKEILENPIYANEVAKMHQEYIKLKKENYFLKLINQILAGEIHSSK